MLNSIYEVLNNAKNILRVAKIEDCNASAEVLLSGVLKVKRSKLAVLREQKLTEEELSLFNSYIQRRAKREPAAYILGSCEFMGFEFKVNQNVLIPRPETELLVEEVLKSKSGHGDGGIDHCHRDVPVTDARLTVLDLCTGSGCIAVSLSKLGNFKEIYASDISAKALEIARKNARLNASENIIFLQGDAFVSVKGKKFDIIVSNPPYVSEKEFENLEPELKYEPQIALTTGEDGLFFYQQIARHAKEHLNAKGQIFLELNANKSVEIKEIFLNAGFSDIKIIRDYVGLDRILVSSKK